METDTDRHFIERMHWDEVARRIGDGAVAILPIGSAAKQHGFHLPLNTDRIQGNRRRMVGLAASTGIRSFQRRQIESFDHINHVARQVRLG